MPCAIRSARASVISGAVLKSISAIQSGITLSFMPRSALKSYLRQSVPRLSYTVSKSYFIKTPLQSLLKNTFSQAPAQDHRTSHFHPQDRQTVEEAYR